MLTWQSDTVSEPEEEAMEPVSPIWPPARVKQG
jgi:hypothetical protein